MRVLFLSPGQCWPLDSGRRLREYHLAKAIAARAELTILCFAAPGRDKSGLSFCETIPVPPPSRYTPAKLLRGALTATPLPVINYTSAEMKARLGELLERRAFDVVQVEFIGMSGNLPPLEALARKPRIAHDWHDIESQRMIRYRSQTASPFKPMERYKSDFRCICADLRNANPGLSTGPLEIDRPWDAYADN